MRANHIERTMTNNNGNHKNTKVEKREPTQGTSRALGKRKETNDEETDDDLTMEIKLRKKATKEKVT